MLSDRGDDDPRRVRFLLVLMHLMALGAFRRRDAEESHVEEADGLNAPYGASYFLTEKAADITLTPEIVS